MAHFMNSEISTPLNNDMYTEYADVFSFLFRLSTLKLFVSSLLGMYDLCKMVKCKMVKCQLLLR